MTASDDDLGRVDCGPSQPKLASFPKGRKNRCYRAIWYESFRWLEYSVKQDRKFCFACRNFSTSTSKSDIAFMKTGWNAWAKAMETNRGLRKHDACSDHLLSMTRWESHASQREQEAAGIRNMLDPDRPSVVSNNREYTKMLLQYYQYFCSEETAYRGHNETTESQNAGKWKEFINLMLRTNPLFKRYHDKMKQRYRTYDYTSKRSSNELVKSMAFEVRRTIKNRSTRQACIQC